MKKIAAIPCYNEGLAIGSVVLKAVRHVDEVVVVDDGSTDDTAEVAEAAGAVVVSHDKNSGYGAAIRSCFNYAKQQNADIMVILDFVVMVSMTLLTSRILFLKHLQQMGLILLSALGFWRRISRMGIRMGYPGTGLQA